MIEDEKAATEQGVKSGPLAIEAAPADGLPAKKEHSFWKSAKTGFRGSKEDREKLQTAMKKKSGEEGSESPGDKNRRFAGLRDKVDRFNKAFDRKVQSIRNWKGEGKPSEKAAAKSEDLNKAGVAFGETMQDVGRNIGRVAGRAKDGLKTFGKTVLAGTGRLTEFGRAANKSMTNLSETFQNVQDADGLEKWMDSYEVHQERFGHAYKKHLDKAAKAKIGELLEKDKDDKAYQNFINGQMARMFDSSDSFEKPFIRKKKLNKASKAPEASSTALVPVDQPGAVVAVEQPSEMSVKEKRNLLQKLLDYFKPKQQDNQSFELMTTNQTTSK